MLLLLLLLLRLRFLVVVSVVEVVMMTATWLCAAEASKRSLYRSPAESSTLPCLLCV